MAEIRITIPDNKVQLVLDTATYFVNNEGSDEEEVTKAIALAWLKERLRAEIRQLVKSYQERKYKEEFNFLDPLD